MAEESEDDNNGKENAKLCHLDSRHRCVEQPRGREKEKKTTEEQNKNVMFASRQFLLKMCTWYR